MAGNYQLVIFDWDGTVIDSTGLIVHTIQAACRDVGLTPPDDARARHVIGLALDRALAYAVPEATPRQQQQLIERYRYHYVARDQQIPLYPGARETLEELQEHGYLLAVATGKSRVGLDRSLQETGLAGFFDATRTADETFSKPHPEMLNQILEELMIGPEQALMVGDTTHDLQLAENAGVDAVAMTHGAHDVQALMTMSPLALMDDFPALRTWFHENRKRC